MTNSPSLGGIVNTHNITSKMARKTLVQSHLALPKLDQILGVCPRARAWSSEVSQAGKTGVAWLGFTLREKCVYV